MFPIVRLCQALGGFALAVSFAPNGLRSQQPASVAGEWIARLDLNSQPSPFRIMLEAAGDSVSVTAVSLPFSLLSPNNVEARRISDSWRRARVTVPGASWKFDAGAPPNSLHVEVRRWQGGDSATVTVTFRNETATAPIHHLVSVNPSLLKQYTGTYVLPSGERIYVWPTSRSGPLTYLEEATSRSGTLFPVAPDAYIAGATSALTDPVRVRATFRESANGTMSLTWQTSAGREDVAARSTAHRREEVRLQGPGGLLGCDILIPAQGRAHPGVVLVPGAGANDRYNVFMIAQVFAEHGVAALSCDKRGTGISEGDWRFTSFEQQAQDVAAGARFLRQRAEIDSTRVGIWALSEGTWVAPIVVAANPEISFLILVAAAAENRREGVLISNMEQMRRSGVSDAEIARYRGFAVRYHQAIMDKDAATIENLWKEYSGASWLPNTMPTAQTLNDWSWQRARLTWPYEPGPVLSKVTCPLLAIWGGEDFEMPPRVEKPLLKRWMLAARNSDYTLQVIPGADHTLRIDAPSFFLETGYAPEYFRTILEWVQTRVTRAAVRD